MRRVTEAEQDALIEAWLKRRKQEKNRARVLAWGKSHPEKWKALRRAAKRRHDVKKRGAIGTHTLREWEELKRMYNYCCAICGMQEPFTDQHCQSLTEDHIVPISKGGTNGIGNIQPLCQDCNSRKCDS